MSLSTSMYMLELMLMEDDQMEYVGVYIAALMKGEVRDYIRERS